MVVILLPTLAIFLEMSEIQYGVLAGMTVYAVPQVLAATAPVGAIAVEIGTLVKLTRVLMLGPVTIVLSLLAARFRDGGKTPAASLARPSLHTIFPWFIAGFLIMAAARSAGIIPAAAIPVMTDLSKSLTIVSLAALGLGVDIRAAAEAGPRVTGAAIASVALLGLMSLALIALLAVA